MNDSENKYFRNNSGGTDTHNQMWIGDPPGWLDSYPTAPEPKTRNIKRTTRTVEKYGPEGQLISKEVITEEEEIFDRIVYDNTITLSGINDTGSGEYNPHTTTQMDPNIPYTLTNGAQVSAFSVSG